ncbi:uridine kinase [Odoribacter sp. OttesenSCG-928-L07]|nr:uridine kinase [Odoribacter sp. OttesenSCG-928-L07]MDL2239091.1 uridine kinase [Bacteroidales bacterium OttesenSCG-928-L14]MDL2240004.1 uridine kinase [Bacteroidales bacterium OttesenSCG-928-K22]
MLIIGIAGGSGSGKTTVVKEIVKQLPKDSVVVIPLDSYYKDNGHLSDEEKKKINFDHPSSFEFKLLNKHLDDLIAGKSIEMPVYSYVTCARAKETITVQPKKVIIVEGIMALSNPALRKKLDIKVFVDADSDDRLIRIIGRDVIERGRNYGEVLSHYSLWVKVMHETFIEPTKKYADIIIPQGGQNKVGIDILLSKIKLMIS